LASFRVFLFFTSRHITMSSTVVVQEEEQRRREVEPEADWQSRIDWSAFEPQAETRAAAALTAAARAQGRTAAIRLISGDRRGLARSHFEAEARGEGRLPPEPLEPEARR
jgi:hypothetical protein